MRKLTSLLLILILLSITAGAKVYYSPASLGLPDCLQNPPPPACDSSSLTGPILKYWDKCRIETYGSNPGLETGPPFIKAVYKCVENRMCMENSADLCEKFRRYEPYVEFVLTQIIGRYDTAVDKLYRPVDACAAGDLVCMGSDEACRNRATGEKCGYSITVNEQTLTPGNVQTAIDSCRQSKEFTYQEGTTCYWSQRKECVMKQFLGFDTKRVCEPVNKAEPECSTCGTKKTLSKEGERCDFTGINMDGTKFQGTGRCRSQCRSDADEFDFSAMYFLPDTICGTGQKCCGQASSATDKDVCPSIQYTDKSKLTPCSIFKGGQIVKGNCLKIDQCKGAAYDGEMCDKCTGGFASCCIDGDQQPQQNQQQPSPPPQQSQNAPEAGVLQETVFAACKGIYIDACMGGSNYGCPKKGCTTSKTGWVFGGSDSDWKHIKDGDTQTFDLTKWSNYPSACFCDNYPGEKKTLMVCKDQGKKVCTDGLCRSNCDVQQQSPPSQSPDNTPYPSPGDANNQPPGNTDSQPSIPTCGSEGNAPISGNCCDGLKECDGTCKTPWLFIFCP